MTPPTLQSQLAALEVFSRDLPADLRRLMRERYIMGYEQYGDAWMGRDNLAEGKPEIADTLVYLFLALLDGEVGTLNMGRLRASLSESWMHLAALCKAAVKRQGGEAGEALEMPVRRGAAQGQLEEDQYGFTWGPLRVFRAASGTKLGYVVIVVAVDQEVEIRCSPKGRNLEARLGPRTYLEGNGPVCD